MLSFVNGEGEWFLAVHILTRPHRRQRYERMPVVNRAADYDVDLFEFHDLAEVFEGLGLGPLLFGLGQLRIVDVANGYHFTVVYRRFSDAAPSAAAAYESDSKAIIR